MKTTLLDYPGKVASTVFLGGCNMRCPFCHNMDIVNMQGNFERYSEEDIISFCKKRLGIIDGVCITGGEPTLYPELPRFISRIKALGLLVKLDTNGTNPSMLTSLLSEGLLDYAAMDIKTSIDMYPIVCGNPDIDTASIKDSIQILLNCSIDYEFRTTVIKEYHDEAVMKDIASMIRGAKAYYLQSFVDSDFVPDHFLHPPEAKTISHYRSLLSPYIDQVGIRGIDIS